MSVNVGRCGAVVLLTFAAIMAVYLIGAPRHTEKKTAFSYRIYDNAMQVEVEIEERTNHTTQTTEPDVAVQVGTETKEYIILGYTQWFVPWTQGIQFTSCPYTNCRMSSDKADYSRSTIALMELKHLLSSPQLPAARNADQYWAIVNAESGAYSFNHFKKSWDNRFNISITYRSSSTIPHYMYSLKFPRRTKPLPSTDYYKGKSKDMIAYVTNCNSMGYNRVWLMRKLSSYGLGLDLHGACGTPSAACPRSAGFDGCHIHSKYKFYLSFENSLCTEYITEKFFKVLLSKHYLIPVAMGGLSMSEYTRVAPPNSFIHVDNFTNVQQLAEHLKRVGSDKTLFNQYHKWREEYIAETPPRLPGCELCRIANEQPRLPAIPNLSAWWNDPKACRLSHKT